MRGSIIYPDGTRIRVQFDGNANGQPSLAQMQAAVGGDIAFVLLPQTYCSEDGGTMVVNQDGLPEQLGMNRKATDIRNSDLVAQRKGGIPTMPIVGTVLLLEGVLT